MNGRDLIRNLRWLCNSGSLISKLMNEESSNRPPQRCNDNSEDNDDDIEADDNDDDGLIGRGPQRKRRNEGSCFEEDRHIRRALPEMHSTLSNWTLHGQNLGRCQESTDVRQQTTVV